MSEFERERDRLVAEIAENLAKCVTSVNQLNRNIEAVTTVGAGFEPVQHLWQQFERVMGTSSVATATDQEKLLQPHLPAGTDATAVLPARVAPGGGEAVVLSGPEEEE